MPSGPELAAWVEGSRLGVFVSQSTWAFSAIEMVHLIAIMVFFGLIAIVDLRLLGLLSRTWPITRLCREVLPLAWIAFAISAVTGALVFTAQAKGYYVNTAFRLKALLLLSAGLNVLLFHGITLRGVAAWDRDAPVPLAGRLAGGVSLAIWIAIVALGRWTGYTMLPS